MSVRVLLVDDHPMFRHALRMALERESGIEVVGEVGDGSEILDFIRKTITEIVCLDISMPKMDGIEATKRLLAEHPKIKVIGLSAFTEQYYIVKMLAAGASGYVSKNDTVEEIVRVIQAVHKGGNKGGNKHLRPGPYLTAWVLNILSYSAKPLGAGTPLSHRENQVLTLVTEGHTSGDIAGLLHLASSTVDVHRRNIMRKLNLHNVADLTKYAMRMGLLLK